MGTWTNETIGLIHSMESVANIKTIPSKCRQLILWLCHVDDNVQFGLCFSRECNVYSVDKYYFENNFIFPLSYFVMAIACETLQFKWTKKYTNRNLLKTSQNNNVEIAIRTQNMYIFFRDRVMWTIRHFIDDLSKQTSNTTDYIVLHSIRIINWVLAGKNEVFFSFKKMR